MVLDYLDDGAQRLLLVLCLPLVDGVFATLLVTGAVATFSDIVAVALTLFTGAGSIAVLYSHAETVDEARRMVRQVLPFLLGGAVVVGLVAPVFAQVFYVSRLQYAAGLALLAIAANLLDITGADRFTVPGIILTGLLLSLRNPGALTVTTAYLLPAVGTAALAAAVLYLAASVEQEYLTPHYLKKGAAAVLATIALSLFGLDIPSEVGLAVLAVFLVASVSE